MPAPPRRSRPWSQGNLAGGASANCRSALYGLLCTGRGRGLWLVGHPGYRQSTVHGAAGVRGKGGGIKLTPKAGFSDLMRFQHCKPRFGHRVHVRVIP